MIDKVSSQVYRKLPEFKGSRPKVTPYGKDLFLLTFDTSVKTSNGKTLNRTVRVVSDKNGNIKKMTTSR